MAILNLPLISNLRDKIVEYLYKRVMSSYLHEDYPINKIKTNYNEGELSLDMNNVVLDENALNNKLSNIYYLNGGYLEDENFQDDNFNLPIVFTDHASIGRIKIKFPLFSLLDDNSHIEINQTKIHLKLNLLSHLLSKQLHTNLQETFRNSLMNSSIQIAEDLKNNLTEEFELSDKIKGYEGYEALADVIRRILGRVEFTFNDLFIQLTDNTSTSKIEFKIKHIKINDEEKKLNNDDEKFYEAKSTDSQDTLDSNEQTGKTLIKLINLECFEIYVNDSLISKSNSKHTIRYDIEQNSIEIFIGSILNVILNPEQLDSLISVLTNRADETNLKHFKKSKQSEFKDEKITEDEMIKVKEYLNKERNKSTKNQSTGSNKLSMNRLNQIWSTSFGGNLLEQDNEYDEDDDDHNLKNKKFYEFNYKEQKRDIKKEDKPKELNQFNLTCKIPGLSICLLNTKETEHQFTEFENINLDLISINQHLRSLHNKDCLNLILLNNFINFKDKLNIKLSNLMLNETYNSISENIIFNNGDGSTISENIYIDIDFTNNQFDISSKQDIQINVDLTFYERLQFYLNFNRLINNLKTSSSSLNLIDSTILKDNELDNQFTVNLDLKNLNGKLFFPIPDLTENQPKKLSKIHDDCLEFNSTNICIKVDSKELKVFSDYIELNLIENYKQFREDQQQTSKDKTVQLISSKVCEFRSLGYLKNLIEIIIIFKPDVNGSILLDNCKQQQEQKSNKTNKFTSDSQFLGDNLEDSVFITNIYKLDSFSYQPFKTKNRKIVSDENQQHEAEKILPNDKKSSINYLNSAAKVSKMNIIFNVPQALILFADQDQLNLVYNRLANDLLLWVPFNGANNVFNNNFKNNNLNQRESFTLDNKILESDGNLIEIDENFAHFDANVFNYSKLAQKKQFNSNNDLMTQSFINKDYLVASTNHFDLEETQTTSAKQTTSTNQFMNSFRMCKSGLEESTESDNAMYHSLNYSTVNPIYDLINETTFVFNVSEVVLHFEHKIKENDVENATKYQNQASSPTMDSKLNSIHEFFSNYQLVENQSLLGKKLLVGCVIKMEKDNTTRVFIHGEDVRFKMNNLGPVNKLQSNCVHNNQFLMIGSNKLVSSTGDCKLNLGIEIKRESKDLKKIKIAIQLIDALVLQININEIMKFWNYVNVTDEDVIGYVPPSILTELHVNLINTAFLIEPECFCNNFNNPFYSPSKTKSTGNLKTADKQFNSECPTCENLNNHLENRSGLLLFNDASIVCLIMEKTSETVLKFTFDETSLFFAKQLPDYSLKMDNSKLQSNTNQLKEAYYALDSLSLSNYVCNISCGSLEIDIMLNSGDLKEIKLNNDIINITCCYDSLAALICLLQKHLQSSNQSNNSSTNLNAHTNKFDRDSTLIEQHRENIFNEDFLNKTSTNDNILSELNSNILNTPPDSTETTKNKTSMLYDPSYLDDDEEDVKINAANQIRVSKQQKKEQASENSFYILGYDDFGTGIKVSRNSEPEYDSLSGKFDSLRDCYFNIPQMVNVPMFSPKKTLFRFLLEEMSINLQIFGGTDFAENLISSNRTDDQRSEFSDDNISLNERRSSISSNSSFGSPNLHARPTTVRFADQSLQQQQQQQHRSSSSSSLANERTYDKTNPLNANLSKFDYLAGNFGQQLFIFKRIVNENFFEQIKNSDNRRKSLGGKEDSSLWEDLDLFTHNLTDGFRSSANVAIIKKSGGYKRDQQISVKLELKKMKCLFEKYIDSNPIAWNASYACSEIEIVDCVKKSRINKMLYEYISEKLPKRSQPMLSCKIVNNRILMSDQKIYADGRIEQKKKRRHHSSNSQISVEYSSSTGSVNKHHQPSTGKRKKKVYDSNSSDCDLIISMNPLRINIDQDTILFIMEFFTDFSILLEKEVMSDCNSTTTLNESYSPNNSLSNQPMPDYYSIKETQSIKSGSSSSSTRDSNKQPTFIKHFEFSQDVPIKLDYHGKHVDMKNGAIKGLLMGLAHLNGSELTLKGFNHRHGILGFEKVLLYAIDFWADDIKKYQLPSILGGVGPVTSVIQLFRGIRDLFLMPYDQYKKDKRLVRGLQKGLFSFSTSSTIALLELTNKSLGLIEFAAQILYDLMSGTSSLKKERSLALNYELKWNQPRDAREGALNAYNVLTEGFQQASRNLTLVHGESNTALSLIRKLPANAFILPILTTQATSNILTGVRNQMEPQARKEDQNKWKS